MAYVYRHIRLDKSEVFYIGIGKRENHRRSRTIVRRNPYWKNIVAKTKWVAEILIDDIPWDQAEEKEKEFIALYGRQNTGTGTLVNLTDGGGGTTNHKVTDEVKARLSKINTGKTLSEDHKRKISKALTGKVISDQSKEKMRQAKLGTKHSPETIEKRRAKLMGNKSNTGKKLPIEQRNKMAESQRLRRERESQYNGKML